jgi:hypothetical protein
MKRLLIVTVSTSLVLLFLSGCTTAPHVDDEGASDSQGKFWWVARFKLHWDQQQQPEFFYHILIADQVIRPVLENHGKDIELWRFHRRAAPDKAGNQFSFMFYADAKTAASVHAEIESDELILILLRDSIVESVKLADGESSDKFKISATSDRIWPAEIQQSWPYFIMGVSQSWLEQIRIIGEQIESNELDGAELELEAMAAYYRELNQIISTQWTQYGRHAYFHHINAIYGYVPVYMQEFGEQWRF